MPKNKAADLDEQRKDAAAAYKQATEQLQIAQGVVLNKTVEMAIWGWRWGRIVNDVHGAPQGNHIKAGQLNDSQTLAFCAELGLATNVRANGQRGGASTISALRRVAARVSSEDHLRDLLSEYGNIWLLAKAFQGDNDDKTADQIRDEVNSHKRRTKGYSRFVPPQDWSSYLVQQGLTRGERAAALDLALEAVGPEETFKLWDRAGRPCYAHKKTNDGTEKDGVPGKSVYKP